jgi:hypothetical protein
MEEGGKLTSFQISRSRCGAPQGVCHFNSFGFRLLPEEPILTQLPQMMLHDIGMDFDV